MKRTLILALAAACAIAQLPPGGTFAQGSPAIVGTARGPGRVLAGVKVQVLNARGEIVAATTTGLDGGFSVTGLRPGRYTLHVVGSSGGVIAAATAVLTESGDATVTLEAMAAALERAAAAAMTGDSASDAAAARAPASGRRISARDALVAVAAAAAAAGIIGILATGDEASGRR
jgi:hypothetical protein